MLHPIFSVLISRPGLLVDHVAGYAALVREEASTVGNEVIKRAIAWGVAAFCAVLFIVFAGIAIMVGAVNENFHWTLLVVPGLPLAVAIAAVVRARKSTPLKAFTELRSQLDADAQTLRAMGAAS